MTSFRLHFVALHNASRPLGIVRCGFDLIRFDSLRWIDSLWPSEGGETSQGCIGSGDGSLASTSTSLARASTSASAAASLARAAAAASLARASAAAASLARASASAAAAASLAGASAAASLAGASASASAATSLARASASTAASLARRKMSAKRGITIVERSTQGVAILCNDKRNSQEKKEKYLHLLFCCFLFLFFC
eukprot:jgi/Psemu1/309520/fgenesh1_kg.521_\